VPVLSADLVLRLQKYRVPSRVPPAIRDAAEDAVREARRLIEPRVALWRGAVTVEGHDGHVTLDGVHAFSSRLLARVLGDSCEAYALVLTIGAALEERVDALFGAQAALEGFLLDTAGWAAVMRLGQAVRQRLLAEERSRGRSVTHRVAPGYGDWPLEEQSALLRVFGDARLPVTLTEYSLLLPRKSISGVLGVVPA
jgi:hypothetical protein